VIYRWCGYSVIEFISTHWAVDGVVVGKSIRHGYPENVGWTLVHFLWQGTLLALVLTAARVATKNASASARHVSACVTLILMAAAPLLTFWFYSQSFNALGPLSLTGKYAGPIFPLRMPVRPLIEWVATGWIFGVGLLLLLRLGGLLLLEWTLRYERRPLEDRRLLVLVHRLGIRRTVRFVRSLSVTAPATVGFLRPIVLIPAAALSGLNPHYLDALLIHELAHIRRQDFVVNILQTILETLFFFHPAVWWVSNVVRAEREHCCDDLAVELCGDQDVYAHALVAMQDLRNQLPMYALGATGGRFSMRIDRVLAPQLPRTPRTVSTAVVAALCSAIAAILFFNQLLIGGAADRPRAPSQLDDLFAVLPRDPLRVGRSKLPQHFAKAKVWTANALCHQEKKFRLILLNRWGDGGKRTFREPTLERSEPWGIIDPFFMVRQRANKILERQVIEGAAGVPVCASSGFHDRLLCH
jgi:beta-lactamase regulating signal transducer with metallopeptidase domain